MNLLTRHFQRKLIWITLFLIVYSTPSFATSYQSGERIVVDSAINHDAYYACQRLQVSAPIKGDLIAAARTMIIEDTITGDLNLAGENIRISAPVWDDIRIVARSVEISGYVKGDIVVFGAEVTVMKNAIIEGDLTVYAGELFSEGTIKGNGQISGGNIKLNGNLNGNLNVKAGELEINGPVKGASLLAANEITIGPKALFDKDVRYWQKEGKVNIDKTHYSQNFTFDSSLAPESERQQNKFVFFSGVFFVWLLLFGFLMLLIFNFLLRPLFGKGSITLQHDPVKSFGYGVLYFIITPIVVLLFLITVIGIPFGLFLMFFYVFTLIFSSAITSLVAAHYLKNKLHKNWNNWQLVGVALVVLIALHLILMIPLAGFLILVLLVSAAFGSILMNIRLKRGPAQVG